MTRHEPVFRIIHPICDEKHPLCDRWKDDDSEYFERFYTVRCLRSLIENFLGEEGFDKYRHRIPEVVDALYVLGRYRNAFFTRQEHI